MTQRRALLAAGALAALSARTARTAWATPEAMQAAVAAFSAGRVPRDAASGTVRLDIAELVENGNAVPVSVSVQSPMTAADHVQRIALFAPANPQPEVMVWHLGPANGRAQVATRMRLGGSQTLLALVQMSDGTLWQQQADVVVTLAACIEL